MKKYIFLSLLFVAGSLIADEIEVTPENFYIEVTNCKETFILKVYADWCSPCNKMKAITADLSNSPDFKNIPFKKLNAQHSALLQLLGVKYLPTIIIFGPDGEITRLVGGMSKADLKSAIKKNIPK